MAVKTGHMETFHQKKKQQQNKTAGAIRETECVPHLQLTGMDVIGWKPLRTQ